MEEQRPRKEEFGYLGWWGQVGGQSETTEKGDRYISGNGAGDGNTNPYRACRGRQGASDSRRSP